ncbi:MAG: hypothetical protein MUE85_01180 [Microscillaceae bacterium]|jgi:hypothetical protein|nr:hypothetical protein [Microscillaceae bacterium]
MEYIIENEYNFRVYNAMKENIFHYKYEPEYKLAIQTWQNYIPDENIIAIYQYMAQYAFQHQQLIVASINNLQGVDGSFDGVRDWLSTEYLPRAVKYGFKFTATVRPKDFYAQLALEEAQDIPQHLGYTAQNFNDFEAAYEWIKQKLQAYLASQS